MSTSIKLKKSSITGRIPSTSDLDYGELAINYADGILYFKNSSNQVSSINARALGVDSTATFSIIDSAYIEARVGSTTTIPEGTNLYYTDARVQSLVDSSYVQAKFSTLRESDNTLIVSGNIVPSTDSSFSLGTSEKKFKDIHLSGGTVFIDNLALSADSATRTISIGELDSTGVVNVIGVIATVDSAGVSDIVDSAFLESRLQSFVSETELAAFNYSTFDSASAINLIDSAYVQERQSSTGGTSSTGVDYGSIIATATNAIDLLIATATVDYGTANAPAGLISDYGTI